MTISPSRGRQASQRVRPGDDFDSFWCFPAIPAMEQIPRQTLAFLDQGELPGKVAVALEARRPPDFLFGLNLLETQWAFDDQLADLSDAVGTFSNLFDPDALDQATLLNAKTGQRALYGLSVGVTTNHLHLWTRR